MQNTAALITVTVAGSLFILSGPSGVGKNEVYKRTSERLGSIYRSVSATTRAPRENEIADIDYRFISEDEYDSMVTRGEMLEYAGVCGNHYGTPQLPVQEKLHAGLDVVLEIDVQGMYLVRAKYPDAVTIFLAPPNMSELERRLRGRDTETEEKVQLRLGIARNEIKHIPEYDYLIINDDLDVAVEQLCTIIAATRCRPARLDSEKLLRGLLDG